MDPRRHFGNSGEDIAAVFLEEQGYEILDRNFSCLFGELDIVARQGQILAFVEVKTRRSLKFGRPAAAVTSSKQRKLRTTALYYLKRHPHPRCTIRFDVIEITELYGDIQLNHVTSAF